MKITVIVGTEYDRNGAALKLGRKARFTAEAFTLFERALINIAGGFTAQEATGGYLHDDGRLVCEKTRIYTVYGERTEQYLITQAVTTLTEALNQESILISVDHGIGHELVKGHTSGYKVTDIDRRGADLRIPLVKGPSAA